MNGLAERIDRMSIPEPNSGCWLWLGTLNRKYGMLGRDGLAHRASYRTYVGEIPLGAIVLHKCDTPACVNPEHLVVGTSRDNAVDMTAKKRSPLLLASREQRAKWAAQPSLSGLAGSKGLSLGERVERLSIPEPNTGCRLWLGPINGQGYGKIKVHGQMFRAHRVSYEANVSKIPAGKIVLHKCDTPACVNSCHLSVGDRRDNIIDAMKKGRANFARVSTSQRKEWAVKRAVNEGSRPEIARSGWETRRTNGKSNTMTHEQRLVATEKSWETRRSKYGPDGGQSAAIRKVWAKITPEQRRIIALKKWEKRREKYGQAGRSISSRVAWAKKNVEERAEHGRKIKDGRRKALEARMIERAVA